jgi:hypothetical protein
MEPGVEIGFRTYPLVGLWNGERCADAACACSAQNLTQVVLA